MHDRQKLGDRMTWRRMCLEFTPSCGCGSEEEGIKSESDGSGIGGEDAGELEERMLGQQQRL